MGSVAHAGKAQGLDFGDLKIDAACMFAYRGGRRVQFTRSERALLLVLTSNPHRFMTRSRLLDEIATRTSDRSDRNIDFLANRLRSKLGDNAKSPAFIATRYGEGYLWIATPSPTAPIDAFLVIGLTSDLEGHAFRAQASLLMDRLRDAISAGIGPERKVANAGKEFRSAHDKERYSLRRSNAAVSHAGGNGLKERVSLLLSRIEASAGRHLAAGQPRPRIPERGGCKRPFDQPQGCGVRSWQAAFAITTATISWITMRSMSRPSST